MNFNKLKINQEHIQSLREICKWYGIEFEVRFTKGLTETAYACLLQEKIVLTIRRDCEIAYAYTLFFHELAHLHNKHSNKYPLYHDPHPEKFNLTQRINFMRTTSRAELYTEKVGARLLGYYFPDIPYIKGYTKENMKADGIRLNADFKLYFDYLDSKQK